MTARTAVPSAVALNFSKPVAFTDVLLGDWNIHKTMSFMDDVWMPITYKVTLAYFALVYLGPRMMRNRKAMDPTKVLAVWNFELSIYSGVSFYKLAPFLVSSFSRGGLVGWLCYNDDQYTSPVAGYWGWLWGALYVMSKAPEQLDTVFLVLRKRPVIFMHWYHHSVTYFFAQLYYSDLVPWARWGIVINLFVHTMYFYFGIRALGIQVNRRIPQMITTMQIVQFTSGFYFCYRVFQVVFDESIGCEANTDRMVMGLIVLTTYLYLFCEFFYRAYIMERSPTKNKVE